MSWLFGPADAAGFLALVWASEVDIGAGTAAGDEENLELILDIHDDLVGVFSAELLRLRKLGRFPDEDLAIGAGVVLLVDDVTSVFETTGCVFSFVGPCAGVGCRGGVIAGDGCAEVVVLVGL